MSERPRTDDLSATDHEPESTATVVDAGRTRRPELQLAVVRYEDGPDRGTIAPRGLSGVARMETWLSADLSAFEDLSARR